MATKSTVFIRAAFLTWLTFHLQNKMFIYRGKEYEWLEEFSLRLLSQFPNAVRMTSTAPPGDNICNSPGQCILERSICFVCATDVDGAASSRLYRECSSAERSCTAGSFVLGFTQRSIRIKKAERKFEHIME